MNSVPRIVTVAMSAAVLAAVPIGTAAAAPSGNPNVTRTATPAHACAAIPATLAQFGVKPVGFKFSTCVKTLAGRVPNVAFGSPYEHCAALEQGFQTPEGLFKIEYPYVFHAEPGDPFPNLRANTREQCARALYNLPHDRVVSSGRALRPAARSLSRRRECFDGPNTRASTGSAHG